jgi:hypothetical protein
MNKRFFFRGCIVFSLFAILVAGCKKDEEVPPQFEELTFDAQEVIAMLPDGLLASNDPKAQECVEMIEQALDMSAFQDNLVVPDNAVHSAKKSSGDTWSWTWYYMGETWTFYWAYDEDASKKYWTMEIQFGDGDRYDYITAWEMKDGSAGEVVYSFNWVGLYEQNAEDYVDLHWTYRWEKNSSGTYSFSWTYDSDSTEYDYFMDYNIVIFADGSGTLDYYFYDELFYHMEWDALGNGSWHYYFGSLEESGTWTAG